MAGIAGELFPHYLPCPLVMFMIALYTAYRVGYLHRGAFLLGAFTGFFLPSLSLKATAGVIIPFVVVIAYYLFSGAHFFATYLRAPRAWVVTIVWAVLTGLFVSFVFPHRVIAIAVPVLWLCFLPLWSASLRIFHALLFAAVYLGVIYWEGAATSPLWPLGTAVFGMSLLPELLSRLYPERRHKLDSLPVMTPTLNLWQKLAAIKEVLFLGVDFYALAMEKYKWFARVASLAKYAAVIGLLLEIYPLLAARPLLPVAFPLALVLAAVFLFLGTAEYAMGGLSLGLYALVLAAGRGFLAGGFQPAVTGWAFFLFLLGAVIFSSRPRETKKDLEKWKELNKI